MHTSVQSLAHFKAPVRCCSAVSALSLQTVLHMAHGISSGIVSSYTIFTLVKQVQVCEISCSHGCEDVKEDMIHRIGMAEITKKMFLISL